MNSSPDWSLWRSFGAVVEAGSLSAAARKLGLSQPTLGRHIEAPWSRNWGSRCSSAPCRG